MVILRFFGKIGVILATFTFAITFLSNTVEATEINATDISTQSLITDSCGFQNLKIMFDGNEKNGVSSNETEKTYLTLEHDEGIGSIYLIFNSEGVDFTITDNTTGSGYTAEENLFYHQYLDIVEIFGQASTSITLDFGQQEVMLNELYAFTVGKVPQSVQKWSPPAEGATDLLLLSAHGDDDQIFFAGILPHYAVYMGYQVQVVYLTDHHNNEPYRVHEMLDGLWAAGIKTYPVFGIYPDYIFSDPSKSSVHYGNLQYAYNYFERNGYSHEELLGFVVEQLRRFKPKVAVTHDFNGEYGHSHHMLCANLMVSAVEISMDPVAYPDSTQAYGVWDVPKTYIHLYKENAVTIDLDIPQECFDGLTAYQVSKDLAFPCHQSQYKAVSRFINPYATAAQMYYSPSQYGLYRSTVGDDFQKNDFFENIMTYAQQEQLRIMEEERGQKEKAKAVEEARLAEESRLAEDLRFEEVDTFSKPIVHRKQLVLMTRAILFVGIISKVLFYNRKKVNDK